MARGISCRIHPELYNYMERERQKYKRKGMNMSQIKLSQMVAKHLKEKRRGFGLIKNGIKKHKKR